MVQGIELKVILLDIEIPVTEGLSWQGQIIGHVHIIAVSANARNEQIVTAKVVGMVRSDNLITLSFLVFVQWALSLSRCFVGLSSTLRP
jgi:hypothetical protein